VCFVLLRLLLRPVVDAFSFLFLLFCFSSSVSLPCFSSLFFLPGFSSLPAQPRQTRQLRQSPRVQKARSETSGATASVWKCGSSVTLARKEITSPHFAKSPNHGQIGPKKSQ